MSAFQASITPPFTLLFVLATGRRAACDLIRHQVLSRPYNWAQPGQCPAHQSSSPATRSPQRHTYKHRLMPEAPRGHPASATSVPQVPLGAGTAAAAAAPGRAPLAGRECSPHQGPHLLLRPGPASLQGGPQFIGPAASQQYSPPEMRCGMQRSYLG